MSDMALMNGKLNDMLKQLVNMTSLNPVIEMPENIEEILVMNHENVPVDLTEDHLIQIQMYLRLLMEPVVWAPRKLLLLLLNIQSLLPGVQRYLHSRFVNLLCPANETNNDDLVCLLSVDLMPFLFLSKTNFVSDIKENLDFIGALFTRVYTELVNISKTKWRKEILYSQMKKEEIFPESKFHRNLQMEDMIISRMPHDKMLDYLDGIIEEKILQVMGADRVTGIPKNQMLESLVMILQYLTSKVMMDGCVLVNGIAKNEIREILLGMIKVLLSLFVDMSEMILIKEKLHDMLAKLMNISSLNPEVMITENIRCLLETYGEHAPINLIGYHLNEILEYLRSLNESGRGPLVWVPRKLMLQLMDIPKLVPWEMQKKLFSHLKSLLLVDHVPEMSNNPTQDPVCVLPVDLMPLLIHVDKLTKIHKNEILNPAYKVTTYMPSKSMNIANIECNSKEFNDKLLELMDMLILFPENELTLDLQSQVSNILNLITSEGETCEIVMDVLLDHLVAIHQDLLPMVMELNSDNTNLVKQVLNGTIMALLSLSKKRSQTGMDELLESMLPLHPAQTVSVSRIDWNNKMEELLSDLKALCEMLPENDSIQDLQSQIVNIFRMNKVKETNKEAIVDLLVGLLQEILSEFKEFSLITGTQVQIVDPLHRSIMEVLSMSKNISELSPVNRLLYDMLSELLTISKIETVFETWQSLAFLWDVYKDIHSDLVNICSRQWRSEILMNYTETNESLPESELLKNLPSKVLNVSRIPNDVMLDYLVKKLQQKCPQKNIDWLEPANQITDILIRTQNDLLLQALDVHVSDTQNTQRWDTSVGIIKDKLSQIMENFPAFLHQDQMMNVLVRTLHQLTSLVIDGSVIPTGIPKNEIRDFLIGVIKVLLSLFGKIPEMAQINSRIEKMLMLLVNLASFNPVIDIPENLKLLLEMDPKNVSNDLIVDHLGEIKKYLEFLSESSSTQVVWVPKNLLLLFISIQMMLPWILQEKMLSHLKKIMDASSAVLHDQCLIPVRVLLPVDLMPLLKVVGCLLTIPKNEILNLVYLTHMDNDKLLRALNISRMEWSCHELSTILSELMNVCEMLPKSEIIRNVQLQLVSNIEYWINPVSGIPKAMILEHLVRIVDDIMSEFKEFSLATGELNSNIFNNLHVITKTLLGMSMEISETAPTNEMLKDMLSWFTRLSIIDPVSKRMVNTIIVQEVWKDISSKVLDRARREWDHEKIRAITDKNDIPNKSELLKDLQSKVSNISMIPEEEMLDFIVRVIEEKMSAALGINSVKGKSKDQIMERFTKILQHLTSLLVDERISGIPKSEIRNLLIGTIQSLLLLLINIGDMTPIFGKLKGMLSQLLNINSLNPVIEMPENIRSLIEMGPEFVPVNLILDHLSQVKEYMWSLIESSTGPVIWVPRNLLLLCLKIPIQLISYGFHEKVQSHLKKILDTARGMPVDPVCVLPIDLSPLLQAMNFLIAIPTNELLDDLSVDSAEHFLDQVSVMTEGELSRLVNISKMECTSNEVKDLLSQLMNLCKMFPSNNLGKELWLKLDKLYKAVRESGIPEGTFLNDLVVVLHDLTLQVIQIDPEKVIQKNLMFPTLHALNVKAGHIASVASMPEIPESLIEDYQAASLQNHYVFQDKKLLHVSLVQKNQALDDLAGIIKSLWSLTVTTCKDSSVNEKFRELLSLLDESSMENKILMDPEREALKQHGLELIKVCLGMKSSGSLREIVSQLKYLVRLDQASEMTKEVIADRLVVIHQELSELADKFVNQKLEDMLLQLVSRMDVSLKETKNDLVSQIIDLSKLQPESDLIRHLQTRITNILNISKMEPWKIPTDHIIGFFVLITHPLSQNVRKITKAEMGKHYKG